MPIVVHALQRVQAEPHEDTLELGEAQQMVGLFGGAVGSLLQAAIEQQVVFILFEFEQCGRERPVAAVDMGIDQ